MIFGLLNPPASYRHAVVFAYPAWGHTRPLCVLVERMVRLRPTYITLFTTRKLYSRVNTEVSRSFDFQEAPLRNLIRIIALEAAEHDNPLDVAKLNTSFAHAYEALEQERGVVCAYTGVRSSPLSSPDVAILDFFATLPLATIRRSSQKAIKVFAWFTGAASDIFHLWGPKSLGGKGDPRPAIQAEAARAGKTAEEVAEDVIRAVNGSILQAPGLPPMYDYEYHPQELILKGNLGPMWLASYEFFENCDGIILSTAACYEPAAIAGVQEWFGKTSRSVHVVGPLLSPPQRINNSKAGRRSGVTEIDDFLNRISEMRGNKSLIYISFGSVIWPTEPEKVWAFVDILTERRIPFLLNHASPFAVVPDSVRQKVDSYELGMLSPWSPQQDILEHPVTGWFITHGGHNSVLESISAGIPMIFWPFNADQPVNAIHCTYNLDIAYELFEIRNGSNGLKSLCRNGKTPVGTVGAVRQEAHRVLDDALGDDGEKKRANVLLIQKALTRAWTSNGPSQRALKDFLDTNV